MSDNIIPYAPIAAAPATPGYQNNKMFDWVEGMPRPVGRESMQTEQVHQLYHASMALPYRGEWDPHSQQYVVDPRYEDMTYGEVIILKQVEKAANGDSKAAESVVDRLIGKPKQSVESKSMHMSYTEFLELSAQQAADEDADIQELPVYDLPMSAYGHVEKLDDEILEGI